MALTAYRPERPEVIRDTDVEKGFIAAFARHGTAANILMMLMIAAGVWAFFNLRTQFFPDFVQERITVNVSWPDAPAASVDEAIVQVLEPEVRFLENVDSVFASANDNAAVFSLLFKTGTDMEQALADVTSAVDAVENSFPEDAADARIRVSAFRDPVSSILIAGPLSQSGLKTIAERMRDDLLNRGLLEVNVQGARNPEIEVEVDEAALRRLGLTPADVSAVIARRANDLPAGTLGGERAVRTLGTEASADSIADSPIRAEPDGTVIRVGDVAQVTESVPDTGRSIYFQGEPAISLQIRRGPEGDAIRQQAVIREYLEEIRPTLPANITIENYDVRADLILGRVLLLRDNAFYGVLIVLAFLFLFLNMRTAFWIAVGIPVSIAATLGVMWALGLSINMFTLFALILSLGIIVDDAIVVGEYADFLHQQGYKPAKAAIIG
ncbi:MAG: efflux RND transporter permease subunit, partial [Alphaproteobacteria bacterium]